MKLIAKKTVLETWPFSVEELQVEIGGKRRRTRTTGSPATTG